MQNEIDYILENAVSKERLTLKYILSTKDTMVSLELANFYGGMDEGEASMLVERRGLLTTGGFIASISKSDSTGLTGRGAYIRSKLFVMKFQTYREKLI